MGTHNATSLPRASSARGRQGLLAMAGAIGLAGFTHAATLHVPADFGTIQAAINASSSGDTILVGPGVYTQNLNYGGKLIAVRSTAGPAATRIQVSGGKGVILGGTAEISGFTISGAASAFGAGIDVSGAGTIIRGNIFDGNAQTAGGYGAAIGGNAASPIIDGNVFRNNTADGQHLSGVVCFINGSSPVITNNIFEGNPTRGINLTLPSGNAPKIVNNTFVGNLLGIRINSFSPVISRNNILWDNGGGVELGSFQGDLAWTNNLVAGNGSNYVNWPDQTGVAGNISADPRFVNPLSDYHLLFDSPAIDAGSPLDAPGFDFDGTPRPIGAGFDIGAYEFIPEPAGTTAAAALASLSCLRRRRRHPAG